MNLRLGTHMSIGSKKFPLYNSVVNAKLLDTNSLQIFTKSPMKCSGSKITEEDKELTKKYLKETDTYIVIHGQYILNFCREVTNWAVDSVVQDLNLLNDIISEKSLPTGVVIHMGKAVDKLTKEDSIVNFKHAINLIAHKVENTNPNVNLILETSVKSKNDMFYSIEALAELFNILDKETKKRVKFCIDTCHIFASGYDISTVNGMKEYFETFDKLIGIKNIVLIHLNDSKEQLGSNKDRHEELTKGHIFSKDLDSLHYLTKLAIKHNIPMITETSPEDISLELKTVYSLVH